MFIGHTRFSLFVPDSGAWRASNGGDFSSADEYKAYLYSEKRLDLRSFVFLEHTVPTLQKAAEGFEVTHIVSFSSSLPKKYKQKLQETAEKYDVIRLDELPDGDNGYGTPSKVAAELGIEGVFGRYRLDDDDILSTDYFHLVDNYLKPEYVGMTVSLPLGIEAVLDKGRFFNLREAHVPMNSMGLLYVCSRDKSGQISSPKGGPHDKSDRYDPVIIDSRGYGYLRCIHSGQDNAMRYLSGSVMEYLLDGMAKFPPAADFPKLRENFPTVASQLEGDSRVEEISVQENLTEDIFFELEKPSKNISLLVNGQAAPTTGHPALVSFTFVDKFGHRVPTYRKIEGIGASKNPDIGHFVYLTKGGGEFRSLVSLHLGHGYQVKAFKIVGLGSQTSETNIDSLQITHSGRKAKLIAPSQFKALQDSILMPPTQRVIDATYRNRYKIAERIKKTVGEENAQRIIPTLANARRRLMR